MGENHQDFQTRLAVIQVIYKSFLYHNFTFHYLRILKNVLIIMIFFIINSFSKYLIDEKMLMGINKIKKRLI